MTDPRFGTTTEFTPELTLAIERRMLGLYVSGHPLDAYRQDLANRTTSTCQAVFEGLVPARSRIVLGGLLTEPRRHKASKGLSVSGVIEDMSGRIKMTCYDQAVVALLYQFGEDEPALFRSEVSIRMTDGGEERISVKVTGVLPLQAAETDRTPTGHAIAVQHAAGQRPATDTTPLSLLPIRPLLTELPLPEESP